MEGGEEMGRWAIGRNGRRDCEVGCTGDGVVGTGPECWILKTRPECDLQFNANYIIL